MGWKAHYVLHVQVVLENALKTNVGNRRLDLCEVFWLQCFLLRLYSIATIVYIHMYVYTFMLYVCHRVRTEREYQNNKGKNKKINTARKTLTTIIRVEKFMFRNFTLENRFA